MANPISSPGDPLFYLHHTWLDKVWWDWQAKNLSSRLYDISGNNQQLANTTLFDVPGGNGGLVGDGNYTVTYYTGDPGNTTTLDHVLSSLNVKPNVTARQVMDIRGGYLCYEYI
jgi:tyrosinase